MLRLEYISEAEAVRPFKLRAKLLQRARCDAPSTSYGCRSSPLILYSLDASRCLRFPPYGANPARSCRG
jgi:hypothetical protein